MPRCAGWIFRKASRRGPTRLSGSRARSRFEQLLKAFGSAEKAWKAPAEQFSRLGWGPKELELLKERDNLMVGPILEAIIKYGANVITLEEETYPKNLLQIPAPPPLIYVRGELLPRDNLSLAVVGSRRATK